MALTAAAPAIARQRAPLAAKWAEYQATERRFITSTNLLDEDPLFERLSELRDSILIQPITCALDAAAKVRMAAVSLDAGELANGYDVVCLAQVAAWLEAR